MATTVGVSARCWGGVLALVVAILGMSLFLFPWDADGAFALNDPLHFAFDAENDPWGSIVAHHPLFHVFANGLTVALRAAGVGHPGHVAVRLLGGLGAAGVVLLLVVIAGPGRRGAATLLALPLVATRGFIVEAATGETVLPACAAALLALWWASRPQVAPWRAAAALVLALWLRQDNVLLVPGFAAALALRMPQGRRLRTVAGVLVGAGVVTLAGYLAAWQVSAPDENLDDWMIHLATLEGRSWAMEDAPRWELAADHLAVSGVAVTGLQGPADALVFHLSIGLSFVGLLLLGGWLLRGTAGHRWPFVVGVLLVLACRFPFFLWFEPFDFEWWMLPLVLVAAIAALWARGDAAPGKRQHRMAGALLVVGALAILITHMPWTWQLRDRHIMAARAAALSLRTPRTVYMTYRHIPHTALHLAQVPHDAGSLHGRPSEAIATLRSLLAKNIGPTVLLVDRFVYDGMPFTLRQEKDELSPWLDGLEDKPGERFLRHEGRVCVLGWHLDR